MVTFGGTATGNISIAWDGDVNNSVATFTRGGIERTADFSDSATAINLAAGQTLAATAANVNGVTIDGAGTVQITALHDTLDADLSDITAATVTAQFRGTGTFTRKRVGTG